MSLYRNPHSAQEPTLALPIGELRESRVVLADNARSRERVRVILERLGVEASEWFSVPTTVDESSNDLVLDYSLEPTESMSFMQALPRFLHSPATYLPELIGLARYLAGCADVLAKVDVAALIAPATLRYAPERNGAWRLMVVPLLDVELADWATSSPAAWLWTPSRMLFGKPGSPAYAVGAALTSALCPPTQMRFHRALRGWAGRPAKLAAAVRAALPASFADEAAALTAFITATLEPEAPSDWRDQLASVAEQLHAHRLAARWEYEGRLDTARGILERLAATTPKEHVPWDVLARVRDSSHDAEGALGAAIKALETPDTEDAVRELAATSRRIAHTLPAAAHRPMLERALAAVDRLGPRLGDLGRLHFAHLEARFLDRDAIAIRRLEAPASDRWDNVLRDTLLARIHAGRAEWAHVAKLCKQAKAASLAMPNGAGQLGAYVVAYLDYLDGVAHFGAVRVYSDPGYLADAFDKLVATCVACAPGEPLLDSAVDWLHAIAELALTLNIPAAATIRAGIYAYLGTQGLLRRTSEQYRRETPPIAWYDASRLLALSGAP